MIRCSKIFLKTAGEVISYKILIVLNSILFSLAEDRDLGKSFLHVVHDMISYTLSSFFCRKIVYRKHYMENTSDFSFYLNYKKDGKTICCSKIFLKTSWLFNIYRKYSRSYLVQ